MILTYKIKHNHDFTIELQKAKLIAEFAIKTRTISSKDVKQFGLKSIISNQILRKYSKNKKCKSVKNVKLTIPNQGINFKENKIKIPSLNLILSFEKDILKINQIELDNTYAYISCDIKESPEIKPITTIGVDLNTKGHCAVVACVDTGKVWKLGKSAFHIHNKYKNIRKKLQKEKRFKSLKQIKNKESRIIKDLNHKISKKIVQIARENQSTINLENLKGIRKNKKHNKNFKYALNSWSFYQLRQFIEYKAKLAGIPVTLIEPQFTSQTCSKCGLLGERNKKIFKCSCGHIENADSNAAFNIAKLSELNPSIIRLHKDRDLCKGNSDFPEKATK